MRRLLPVAGLVVLMTLVAACTGSEPGVSTTIANGSTTIAVPEGEFESWQEWADWRMNEMGIFEEPRLRCSVAAGLKVRLVKGGIWEYEGVDEATSDQFEELSACYNVINEKLAACVVDLGWTVEYDQDGNWWQVVSPDLSTSYDRDYARCEEAVASEDRPGFSPDELPYLYAALTEAYQCILNLNFDIPPPPPFDEWARTFDDPDTEPWDPFKLIESVRRNSIIAACPKPLA